MERSAENEGLSNVPVTKDMAPAAREGPALDSSLWTVPAAKLLLLYFMENQSSSLLQIRKHFKIFKNLLVLIASCP